MNTRRLLSKLDLNASMTAPTKTILIVDDDAGHLSLLKRFFESHGYAARTALNGEAGLRAARRLLPNLIILDLKMPVMDGAQTLAELYKDKTTRAIPVFILSGAEIDERTGLVLKQSDNFKKFIEKPASLKDILKDVILHIRMAEAGISPATEPA